MLRITIVMVSSDLGSRHSPRRPRLDHDHGQKLTPSLVALATILAQFQGLIFVRRTGRPAGQEFHKRNDG